jgi:hypothetical protein
VIGGGIAKPGPAPDDVPAPARNGPSAQTWPAGFDAFPGGV